MFGHMHLQCLDNCETVHTCSLFLMRPRSRKKKLEMKLIHHGRKNCPFHIHAFRYVYTSMVIRVVEFSSGGQRYTYRVLQTIQMKLIFLCVWAEWAILGIAKIALKFKYEI